MMGTAMAMRRVNINVRYAPISLIMPQRHQNIDSRDVVQWRFCNAASVPLTRQHGADTSALAAADI